MNFEQSIVIDGAPGELFALTQDYARRLEWDPFLKSAQLLNSATSAGVGVRAYCVARNGLSMETEYVSFNPPRACAVRMTRGPGIIASFAGSWRFEEASKGQTRVGFRYNVQAKPWILTPIVEWIFRRDTERRLTALKDAVEQQGLLKPKVRLGSPDLRERGMIPLNEPVADRASGRPRDCRPVHELTG